MSYVTIAAFQKFTNVYENNNSLQQSYIDSAENIVANYLGYNPVANTYTISLNGNGTSELQLRARPIQELLSVTINGIDIPVNNFEYTGTEFIYYKNNIFPRGKKNITVSYIAGFGAISLNDNGDIDGGDADDLEETTLDNGYSDSVFDNESDTEFEMPKIIKLTVLRIAALLQTESDSNIGITSKSFADSGTRTFINSTNFDKYLIQISKYALLRI